MGCTAKYLGAALTYQDPLACFKHIAAFPEQNVRHVQGHTNLKDTPAPGSKLKLPPSAQLMPVWHSGRMTKDPLTPGSLNDLASDLIYFACGGSGLDCINGGIEGIHVRGVKRFRFRMTPKHQGYRRRFVDHASPI